MQDGLHNIEQGRGALTDFRYHCPGLWHEASQSVRSAAIGSRRDARLTGSQEANAATDIKCRHAGKRQWIVRRDAIQKRADSVR